MTIIETKLILYISIYIWFNIFTYLFYLFFLGGGGYLALFGHVQFFKSFFLNTIVLLDIFY